MNIFRKPPLTLKAGDQLIPIENIESVFISDVERERVLICTKKGAYYEALGFDALEAVMVLRPSAMEGRRLRWRKHAWAFHNLVGHPVMQIMAWCGLKRAAVRWHDWTTPMPRGWK